VLLVILYVVFTDSNKLWKSSTPCLRWR